MIVPAENAKDVPPGITGIEVVSVTDVADAFEHIFQGDAVFGDLDRE